MDGLSILIPTYNDECVELVRSLRAQCAAVLGAAGKRYEIVVADDGSTDTTVTARNRTIGDLPDCSYIIKEVNSGRAAIRNFLAREFAYDLLLFIDSDMTVLSPDFIGRYMSAADENCVVYGGYDVPEQQGLDGNLRYRYERSCRKAHTAAKRREHPYADFHTSNFMIPRRLMLAHPLNENYRNYGYEDVAYGKELRSAGIRINHIDNPVGFCRFEPNPNFISKTEEGLRTLADFRDELHEDSRLLQLADRLNHIHVLHLVRSVLKPMLPALRQKLTNSHPPLVYFNLYKLGYLLTATSATSL